VDAKGAIVHINEQIERMFGYDRGELIGMPVETLVPLRARASHARLRMHFSDAPEARPMGAGRELFAQRKDGSEFPIEIGLAPCHDSAGPLILASVVDITERKEMEHRHQSLLRRMWQEIDMERLRLAHELHDETGQSVTAVMLQLGRIEKDLDEVGRHRLRWLRHQLEDMGKSLHRIAWQLRPASLDELGLRSALANYVSDWAEQSGIHGDFHCRDDRLDDAKDEIRTIIYRVVQEALTNIVKHAAGATTASVVVDSDPRMIRVTIEDDGCGFDNSQTTIQRSNGLGLAGMRERLTLVSGEIDIESTPKLGTTLFVRIPCDRETVQ
jgi:PAS domain S-box-containing protein